MCIRDSVKITAHHHQHYTKGADECRTLPNTDEVTCIYTQTRRTAGEHAKQPERKPFMFSEFNGTPRSVTLMAQVGTCLRHILPTLNVNINVSIDVNLGLYLA